MKKSLKKLIFIGAIFILTATTLNPIVTSTNPLNVEGFDKGPSNFPVVPLKKTTLVNFDKDSLIDDYAYLASIPSAAFRQDGNMYSYPLLYYQDLYVGEHEYEKTLNARQGLDYFMEDWMGYCNGELDEMTLINVPKNKVSQWDAKEYTLIESDDPYEIAADIALNDWAYSNSAVVAVIDEQYTNPNIKTKGSVSGHLDPYQVGVGKYTLEKPIIGSGATYHPFEINNQNYKYIVGKMSWEEKFDYDLQLFDDQLGMVQASANSFDEVYPWSELVGSYIHNYGDWEVSVSAFAKKSINSDEGKFESMFFDPGLQESGLSSLFKKNTIDVDVSLLPGMDLLFKATPYGCRNIDLTLTWDNPGIELGFTLLDPIKNEIASTFSLEEVAMKHLGLTTQTNDNANEVKIHLEKLGECNEAENYSVCVFSLDDIHQRIDFSLEYSWNQNVTKNKGDNIESVTNGAVLASSINAPLLFTSTKNIPEATKNALYKLGVKRVYFANIGNHASINIKDKLNEISNIEKEYINALDIFNDIRDSTDQNDIIFTTMDSWDYWHIANTLWDTQREPVGEFSDAYHFGPAAYLAAHHGSPVLLVDNHPKLSQAITWSTHLWTDSCAQNRIPPSSAGFVLTAKKAYEFLEENGFGKIEVGGPEAQDREIIITVAGQYDIGIPWDRSFTGAGINGRFWGSPVDCAYSISRNVFYPALIFMNPAMRTVTLMQGSESTTKAIGGHLQKPYGFNLVITKSMQEEEFTYPVLQSYGTYSYRVNEEKIWDHLKCRYTRADGIIPWVTPSPHSIDDGVAHGKSGAYYPDISESEVIPFYCNKAGYSNVFSTNYDYVIENLNKGVLIWCFNYHGHQENGGKLEIWDPESPYVYEENPWRAYESILIKSGNIDEFFVWIGFHLHHLFELAGIENTYVEKWGDLPTIPFQLFQKKGSTENPDVAFLNPQLTGLSNTLHFLYENLIFDVWGPWPFMVYRDRLFHPLERSEQDLPLFNFANGDGKVFHMPPTGGQSTGSIITGLDFDDDLENIHSCGMNSISCFPANTYMHLTWMRHGMTWIIIDPWSTSDWAGVWEQMMIKLYAMGYTVGEAYERGIRAVGPEYSCNQWWWDTIQNICFYGDPNLRPFVPNTEYTDHQNGYEENHWTFEEVQPLYYDEELSINGHMPFGADIHPHEIQPSLFGDYFILVLAFVSIVMLLLIARFIPNKKR